ncbi:hypothetical protein PENTCL1PPCAC_23598, partial [Pristionchus entomophagus]
FKIHHKLHLADQYNLRILRGDILSSIFDDRYSIDDVIGSDSYVHYSSRLKSELLKKVECAMTTSENNEQIKDESKFGLIQICVKNFNELSSGARSEIMRINGFPWTVKVYRQNNFVYALIDCKKSLESSIWKCEVEAEIKLIDQNYGAPHYCKDVERWFYYNWSSEVEDIYEWDELIENDGYVVDGGIVVEVMINVKGRSGDEFPTKLQMNSLLVP